MGRGTRYFKVNMWALSTLCFVLGVLFLGLTLDVSAQDGAIPISVFQCPDSPLGNRAGPWETTLESYLYDANLLLRYFYSLYQWHVHKKQYKYM